MATDYLKKILTARVYDVARETELELAPALTERLGNRILLKREDNQPVFSFKLRGAYNKMAQLSPAALKRGVIAASAGNHAQGVALAAAKMKCKAVIVMPVTTPAVKIDAVKARGGSWIELVLFGESYSDAFDHAKGLEKKRGLSFVHPFDDPDVIAGQGTIAQEILQQHQAPIDAIFVAIGGGGHRADPAVSLDALFERADAALRMAIAIPSGGLEVAYLHGDIILHPNRRVVNGELQSVTAHLRSLPVI
jgi:threonine dehydratase